MNVRRLIRFLPLLGLLAGAALAAPAPKPADPAAPTPPAPAPAPQRELALVVVESLNDSHGAITPFDRLDIAFHDVAKARHWPVKLIAERFAGNTPDHPTELRLFPQPIREETPAELGLRVWVTLTDRGTKHDFGVIKFTYYPRFGESSEDMLEKIYRGLAERVADKIEPLLFPKS